MISMRVVLYWRWCPTKRWRIAIGNVSLTSPNIHWTSRVWTHSLWKCWCKHRSWNAKKTLRYYFRHQCVYVVEMNDFGNSFSLYYDTNIFWTIYKYIRINKYFSLFLPRKSILAQSWIKRRCLHASKCLSSRICTWYCFVFNAKI